MLFVISGGGTAGHIYPAIAVGQKLVDKGHDIVFAGTPLGLESKLAPEAGFEYKSFDISGFNRTKPITLIKSGIKALKSSHAAKKWLKEIEPDAVIGFGGYVSIPVGKAAEDIGIPLILHEQNSACGMANKYLAPHASAIAITYEAARSALRSNCDIELTGNPVRPEMLDVSKRSSKEFLHIDKDKKLLLVFGGSSGARHINTAIANLAKQLLEIEDLYIIHIAGPKEYDSVKKSLNEQGIELTGPEFSVEGGWENPGHRYILTNYFNHMAQALSACDVVVSRAGATTLAEITAVGACALLVPYPYATDDHQTKNASTLVDEGAAYMCADDRVESSEFADMLMELLNDEQKRQDMEKKTKQLGRVDAADRVAQIAIDVASASKK